MFDSLMLRVLQPALVAAMQLFSVYVLLHGHYSPGGGFVAGVLLASSMILPRLTSGAPDHPLALSPRGAMALSSAGILLFAAVGALPLAFGAELLDHGALPLPGDAPSRRSFGILLIEVGVTMAVAGAMLAIFEALAREAPAPAGEDGP